ncbi:MAG: ABC transporter ATP-binding protein [Candidatus Rokubacteria bacterium]|nr:ABC transporter ATP-binding protein [Candidatus Rokubacteria bacterium]
MPDLIAIEGVTKVYPTLVGETTLALDDVSLTVAENEFLTIVGPSGCGKSTLLKLVAGVLSPTRGRIVFRGRPLAGPTREVGMVFQSPVLMPWRTVLDNVLFPIEMLRLPVARYRDEARRLIELTGLGGFERAYPRELSGGMQQRVSICRALVYDPPLLLMDEPFGALDAMTREEMGMELLAVWHARRKTVVFVTHSIPEAVLLADRVVVMTPRPGRVVTVTPVELPRPRTLDMEFSREFSEHASAIRARIADGRGRGR